MDKVVARLVVPEHIDKEVMSTRRRMSGRDRLGARRRQKSDITISPGLVLLGR